MLERVDWDLLILFVGLFIVNGAFAKAGYATGVVVGGIMGYYGGWTDIIIQRFIKIYGSIPFLYTIMILASSSSRRMSP